MLQTLFLVVFTSVIAISIGLNIRLILNKSRRVPINEQHLVLAFFSGFAVCALLSSWITLFAPLTFYIFLPLALISFINIILKRKCFLWDGCSSLKDYKFEAGLFILIFLLFIQLGSLEPYTADTGIYHLQIVRWNQQFKTVAGLANLFPRFGFYSNWFHLISIFSFSPNQSNLLYLNTSVSIWFTLFLLFKIGTFKKGLHKEDRFFTLLYSFILLFMFLGWNLLRGNCRSMGNDFIVTVLILYVLLNITENRIKNSDQIGIEHFSLLTIAIPFFKISGTPSLLLLCAYFIQTKRPLKTYIYSAFLLLLFSIPFFIKNYLQSGYLFFPYTFFDVFTPEWKLPKLLANRFNQYITLSNKYIYEGVPTNAWNDSSFNWLHTWFFKLAFYDRIILVFFGVSCLFLLYYGSFRNHYSKRILIYLLVALPVVGIWFFTSPDPRFIYGYIVFNTFAIYSIILYPFISKPVLSTIYGLTLIIIFLFSISKIATYKGPFVNALCANKPLFKEVVINNKTFFIPLKTSNTNLLKCEDLPIPCLYQTNPYLELRGKSFEAGFKINKNIDSFFLYNYVY